MKRSRTKEKTPGLPLDNKACYAAMQAHDTRFDGQFFCGVSSTGIYCRPVCRVKLPKQKNCTFFVSAAAAEAAGYRPCLRCRPELAPGSSPVDSVPRLARTAAVIMAEDSPTPRTLSDIAAALRISDRHLRRVFVGEYGVSPVQYLQTRHLLLAKSLLTDTQLSVSEVAMAAGFQSIRRFNDLFKRRYRLTPKELRRNGQSTKEINDAITLLLGYRPPYAWDSLISFIAARIIPGVESVAGDAYRRTVAIRRGETIHYGWISVANRAAQNTLSVTVSPTLLPVLSHVLARTRVLFDVNCIPDKVYEKLRMMDRIVPGIAVPGIRVPGSFDPFEMSVRAILGQQVTLKAAGTLAARLVNLLGERVETPFTDLAFAFPRQERIFALNGPAENHMGPLGITGSRARSISALAAALTTKSITLSHDADPREVIEKLRTLPGFGPWTIQYIAMRALGWPDAFPENDLGIKKALGNMSQKEISELSRTWSPWRSYATILLWNSLAGNAETPNEQ